MARVKRPVNLSRRTFPIPSVNFLDIHDGERVVARIAQGDARIERRGGFGVGRQRHGDGEENAVRRPHVLDHRAHILARHEAVERRESAGGEHLEIADGALRYLDGRQPRRFIPQPPSAVFGRDQIHKFAPIRRDDFGAWQFRAS